MIEIIHYMSMIEEKKALLLTFVGCKGLGLQSGNKLIKISQDRFEIDLNAATCYLLDDSGKILCTLVNGKSAYESGDNEDRRVQNSRNGFAVTWASDGLSCSVSRSAVRRGLSPMAKLLITIGIIGVAALAALAVWYVTSDEQEPLSPDKQEIINILNEKIKHGGDSIKP